MTPIELLRYGLALVRGLDLDGADDWPDDEAPSGVLDLLPPDEHLVPVAERELECAADRTCEPNPVVADMQARAATATYRSGSYKGKRKRTLFPRVDLRRRRVVVVLHQTGFEAPSSSSIWPRVTCHRAILPDATVALVHPIDVRLVAANRLDRAPWHAISIEIGGNFERDDGRGNWHAGDTAGRGRASDGQLQAAFDCIGLLCSEVRSMGGVVEAVLPHRVAGRDKRGRPNRQACPGSRVWSLVGERAGAELGLAVPDERFVIGGSAIPASWHGPHWQQCRRFLRAP